MGVSGVYIPILGIGMALDGYVFYQKTFTFGVVCCIMYMTFNHNCLRRTT